MVYDIHRFTRYNTCLTASEFANSGTLFTSKIINFSRTAESIGGAGVVELQAIDPAK